MKRKLLCALLTGAMVLSAGSAVLADEAESETSNVNEDGSVNDPSKVEVDENKLVMWSLFTGGDGEYMTKIIDDYNATAPANRFRPSPLYGQIITPSCRPQWQLTRDRTSDFLMCPSFRSWLTRVL